MAIDEKLLLRGWLHAHEEDTPGRQIYRPDEHPLPPARGRSGYEFQAGGHLTKRLPGPTDRRVTREGTWTMDPHGHVTIRVPGSSDEVLEIESLEPDRLIVRK